MPTSSVLQLEALTDGLLTDFTGRGVHGFWFNRWRQADPALGDRLHGESQEAPFTLSPLLGLPRPRRQGITLRAGQTAFLRVTCLTDDLAAAFREKWLNGLEAAAPFEVPPARREEGREVPGIAWKVAAVLQEEGAHPLVAAVAYEELSRRRLINANPPRQWQVEFFTPTTFNTGRARGEKDNHLPFPLPESLMKSWLRRWQAFAPIALPEEEILDWARTNLAVSAYRLHTLPAREGERLRVGCVGRLTLRALDMPPYLRAAVDLLAHFAFFCGSGGHTAQGMGQTRLVDGIRD